MASPFTVFRKHQKVFLAVLALLAMIAFVFLSGPVFDALTTGNVHNPVVVRTKVYGDLTELELANLIRQQNLVRTFFERVYWTLGFRLPVEPPSEESAVETWLLANRARELGIVISNQMINAYIQEMTGKRVPRETFRQILREMHVTDRQLFEALRQELAARQMLEMIDFSAAAATPAQRWEYYQRLHRRATVELVAEPVAKYLDRVGEPEEATLREFFEKYKENYYDPTSPEPGFRRPHRVAVEYLKAEIAPFLAPSSITEEQIQQYYEKHKDTYYLRSKLPPAEKAGPAPAPPEAKSPPESKTETPPPSTSEPKQPPLPQPTAKQVEPSAKPPEEKPSQQISPEEKRASPENTEKPAGEKTSKEAAPSAKEAVLSSKEAALSPQEAAPSSEEAIPSPKEAAPSPKEAVPSAPKTEGSARRTDPIGPGLGSAELGGGGVYLQETPMELGTVSAEAEPPSSPPVDQQPDSEPPKTEPAAGKPETAAEPTPSTSAGKPLEAKPAPAGKDVSASASSPLEGKASEKPPETKAAPSEKAPAPSASEGKPSEKPSEAKAAPPEKAPVPSASSPAEGKPSEKPSETKPGLSEKQPVSSVCSTPEGKPSEKPAEAKPSDPTAADGPASSAPASKYVPLEEVREEIREVLARGQAQAKIEQMLQKIRDQMNSYSQARLAALAAGREPPKPLNLEALAKQHGLQYRRTPLVGEWQLRQDYRDIALAQVAGRESVIRVLYYQGRPPLQPMLAQDLDAYYLFWKVEDAKEAIPSWDYAEAERLEKEAEKARQQGQEEEAARLAEQAQRARKETDQLRQEVLRAWKMIQARGLARDRAAQLAALARKTSKPLQEALAKEPGVAVLEAGPFSWLTYGGISPRLFMQAPPPRISSIPQVELPGEEFMQTVFRMEPGQVDVAFNHPQTVAYVIRVKSFEPSDEVLWKMFLAEPYSDYSSTAMLDQQKIRRAWLEQLKRQIGFRWERKPHPGSER